MYFVINNIKKGDFFNSTGPANDVARKLTWRAEVDEACETSARMRRCTEATWQGHGWPTRGAGGVDTWQEATRVHTDAHEGCRVAGWSAREGPTG